MLSKIKENLLTIVIISLIALFLFSTVKENYKINTHNNQIYLETEEDKMKKIFRREDMTVEEEDVVKDEKNNDTKMSFLPPDAGFHKDDISSINDNMKLYYTIFDHRSYNKGDIMWKDLSFHSDRYRVQEQQNEVVDKGIVVNRSGKFYGNVSPPYSKKTGLYIKDYCLILPASEYLGLNGLEYTIMFYGKFNKNSIKEDIQSQKYVLFQAYANTKNNIGISIEIEPLSKDTTDREFVLKFNGSNIGNVHTYKHSTKDEQKQFKIIEDIFMTYAFVIREKSITFYQGSQSQTYQLTKPIPQIFFSNKKALVNKTRNIPMCLKTFAIQNKALSAGDVDKYDTHMKQNEAMWDEQMQQFLRYQDEQVKKVISKEQALRDELKKVRECPFEDRDNESNPCNKECGDINWSGQIINNSKYTSGQNPLTPKCADRVIKHCLSQEKKEASCRCFDIEFAQDNAYCADQLNTLYLLQNQNKQPEIPDYIQTSLKDSQPQESIYDQLQSLISGDEEGEDSEDSLGEEVEDQQNGSESGTNTEQLVSIELPTMTSLLNDTVEVNISTLSELISL